MVVVDSHVLGIDRTLSATIGPLVALVSAAI